MEKNYFCFGFTYSIIIFVLVLHILYIIFFFLSNLIISMNTFINRCLIISFYFKTVLGYLFLGYYQFEYNFRIFISNAIYFIQLLSLYFCLSFRI